MLVTLRAIVFPIVLCALLRWTSDVNGLINSDLRSFKFWSLVTGCHTSAYRSREQETYVAKQIPVRSGRDYDAQVIDAYELFNDVYTQPCNIHTTTYKTQSVITCYRAR
jgi:hypothetical protein